MLLEEGIRGVNLAVAAEAELGRVGSAVEEGLRVVAEIAETVARIVDFLLYFAHGCRWRSIIYISPYYFPPLIIIIRKKERKKANISSND